MKGNDSEYSGVHESNLDLRQARNTEMIHGLLLKSNRTTVCRHISPFTLIRKENVCDLNIHVGCEITYDAFSTFCTKTIDC